MCKTRIFLLVGGLVASACHGERGPAPAASAAAPDASTPSPARSPPSPSLAECESLWSTLHAAVPDDPYTPHDFLLARCQRSERAVLTCPQRVLDEASRTIFSSESDAGVDPQELRAIKERMTPFVLATRVPICLARERLLFALRSGELDALGRSALAGELHPDEDGVVVLRGTWATLPSRGFIEREHGVEPAPEGEARMRRLPDGRVWIYFLGGMFGRHQNQAGFLFSSAPFDARDFHDEEGRSRVCLGASDGAAPRPPRRYLLSCFEVLERHGPQLLELGAAPD